MGEGIYSLDQFLDEMPLPRSMQPRSELANQFILPWLRWNHQRNNQNRTTEHWSLRDTLFMQLGKVVGTGSIDSDYSWQKPGLRFYDNPIIIRPDFVVTYEDAKVRYATAFLVEPGLAADRIHIARRKLNGWPGKALEDFNCMQTATIFAFSDGLHGVWWNYNEITGEWSYTDEVHPPRYTFIEATPK